MEASHRINNFIDWMLKIGIIVFIGSVLLEVYLSQTPDNEFWLWTLRIFLLVFFVVVSAILLGLDKKKYYIFGFFLVLVASLYKIVNIASFTINYFEIPVFILLIAVSFYFLTKTIRTRHHHN
jgi:hypothetical protein